MLLPAFLFSLSFASGQIKVKGRVFDAETKELLVGVSIYAPALKTGTTTSPSGTFSLECAERVDSISISYVGYKSRKVGLGSLATEKHGLSIGLQAATENLQPIVVTASRDRQERT